MDHVINRILLVLVCLVWGTANAQTYYEKTTIPPSILTGTSSFQGSGRPGLIVPSAWINGIGLNFNRATTSGADVADFFFHRTANYTGGSAGFVNTALEAKTVVSAGTTSYEWNGLFIMDNSGTSANAAQNVALAAQAFKRSTGITFALYTEFNDDLADPTSGSIGAEMDMFANGTDANSNRIVQHFVVGPKNYGGTTHIYEGTRYSAQNNLGGSSANAVVDECWICLTGDYNYGLEGIGGSSVNGAALIYDHRTGSNTNYGAIFHAATYGGGFIFAEDNANLLWSSDQSSRTRYVSADSCLEFFTTSTKLFSICDDGHVAATGLITGSLGATISGATTSLNTNSNFDTNINTGTSTGTVTIGQNSATPGAVVIKGPVSFQANTTYSGASWLTTSPVFNATAMTLNDTTASGTVANDVAHSIQAPNFTSTGGASTTITNATTLYVAAPTCTTVVCTNLFGIFSPGKINATGGAAVTGTFSVNGTTSINASQNNVTSINTGTSSSAIHIGDGSGNNAIGIGNGSGVITLGGPTTTGAQITSTVATGTAPLVIASTTNVANLNASSLSGATFAAPGAIGGSVASAGSFTTVNATGLITPSTTVGIKGTAAADAAQAGSVGEVASIHCLVGAAAAAATSVTVTVATPAVVTWSSHTFVPSTGLANYTCPINFTGTPPTGITVGTTYYIIGSSVSGDTFQISTSAANALAGTNAVATTGSDGGTTAFIGAVGVSNTVIAGASLKLTAGDWDCSATAEYQELTAITSTRFAAGVDTSIVVTSFGNLTNIQTASSSLGGVSYYLASPRVRENVSSTTSVFGVDDATFTVGTMNQGGMLYCRRMR